MCDAAVTVVATVANCFLVIGDIVVDVDVFVVLLLFCTNSICCCIYFNR